MKNQRSIQTIILEKFICEWDEMEIILIPEGDFLMGTNENKRETSQYVIGAETPEHTVFLDAYYMAKYPLTNAQYNEFLKENQYPQPKYWDDKDFNGPDHPVVGVSWHDAAKFCGWLSKKTGGKYRLPTEAEWEKACRGTDGRAYPWGDEEPTPAHANFDECINHTTPINAYPMNKSPYGCMDMVGNVGEWCVDWFDYFYYKRSPYRNPTGPDSQPKGSMSGNHRSFRGGYWRFNTLGIESYCRSGHNPSYSMDAIGFRCARTL